MSDWLKSEGVPYGEPNWKRSGACWKCRVLERELESREDARVERLEAIGALSDEVGRLKAELGYYRELVDKYREKEAAFRALAQPQGEEDDEA